MKRFAFLIGLGALLFSTSACGVILGPGSPTLPSAPTVTPIIFPGETALAPTSAPIPSATPVSGAPPELTAIPAGPTSAPPQTPVVIIVTATPPASPPPPQGNCSYAATFLGDVTVPDNTVVPAGGPFVKTWRIRNDGTCTWGSAGYALHRLVFAFGDKLGAPDYVELPAEVRPGMVLDLSVPMVAPATPGIYRGNWLLLVDNGPRVGVGAGNVPLYVQINVVASPPPPGGAVRVIFAAGATDAVVSGTLAAAGHQDYVLSALQGQTMLLTLGANPGASVSVSGVQGLNPQVIQSSGTYWRGVLPATGDYIIRVTAAAQPTNYSLNITIPQRIQFLPGSTGASLNGFTGDRRTVTYLLKASAGQTLGFMVGAPAGSLGITIYGLDDGQPLVRDVSGTTSGTVRLPGTQDYVIQIVPHVDGTINFNLQVVVQ